MMTARSRFPQRTRRLISGKRKSFTGFLQIAVADGEIDIARSLSQERRVVMATRQQCALECQRPDARMAEYACNELEVRQILVVSRPAARQHVVAPGPLSTGNMGARNRGEKLRHAMTLGVCPGCRPERRIFDQREVGSV